MWVLLGYLLRSGTYQGLAVLNELHDSTSHQIETATHPQQVEPVFL